jgi:hypothetical protein
VANTFTGSPEAALAAERAAELEGRPETRSEAELEERYEEWVLHLVGITDLTRFMEYLGTLRSKTGTGPVEAEHVRRLRSIASSQLEATGTDLLRKGRLAEAAYCLESSLSLTPGRPVPAYNAACAYARLGKKGEALRYLALAVDGGFGDAGLMESDKDLEKLRREPAFGELLKRMKAPKNP